MVYGIKQYMVYLYMDPTNSMVSSIPLMLGRILQILNIMIPQTRHSPRVTHIGDCPEMATSCESLGYASDYDTGTFLPIPMFRNSNVGKCRE